MDSSEHSRNPSSDASEHDLKYRESDDMLARRIGGNIPAPLRKKKEESYKRFITPSGDPMTYVKQHMRSKSLSDIQIQNAEKDQERDERNIRYEEMQKLKEMLKEEEETWTYNLDSWKQRRKSATFDARKRKEDREVTEQQTNTAGRKPKTYREIVDDKKKRESGIGFLDDDNDDLFSSLPRSSNQDVDGLEKDDVVSPYSSALSSPYQTSAHTSKEDTKVVAPSPYQKSVSSPSKPTEPVRYTSRVTALINTNPISKNEDSIVREKKPETRSITPKSVAAPRRTGLVWPPPPPPNDSAPAPVVASSSTRPFSANRNPYSGSTSRNSQASGERVQTSKETVLMRPKKTNASKARPKSAYSSYGDNRAQTLPRNYHSYSTPKPFEPSVSDFQKNRKSAFANKLSLFQNIGQRKPEGPPPAPKHLSSLLKQDTDKLHGNDQPAPQHTATLNRSPFSHQSSQSTDVDSNYRSEIEADVAQLNGDFPRVTSNKPKIVVSDSPRENQTSTVKPWQRFEPQANKVESKSIHKPVNAPSSRFTFAAKSATLPPRAKIDYSNEVNSTSKSHIFQQPNDTPEVSRLSPRSPSSEVGTQSEEMKICINQRPKCEKGFGFTVKGAESGKPVVVSSVSPGGAADICQLCVGDEILAINDVRLSSSLTQDDIVRLIVGSVMTGNLSLDIRRFGKSKKPNPLRLSGTKVVMTSGGFVQVRSDKGKAPVISTKSFNGNSTQSLDRKEIPTARHQQSPSSRDFPPPPPAADLPSPKRLSAVDRLSPKKPSPTMRRASPLSNLVNAANSTSTPALSNKLDTGKENGYKTTSSVPINHSERKDEDELEMEVLKAQHDLEAEEKFLQHERRQHEENLNLRKQLQEEQRSLEERERKREEEKRKRIEEAKAEEQRLVEELKKIEAAKLEQQKRREEEKRRLIESQPRYAPTYGHSDMNHWLIEEAERSRIAEEEGRNRGNVFDNNNIMGSISPMPNHETNLMRQRGSSPRNGHNTQPHIPGSLTNYWNDPSTRATLL